MGIERKFATLLAIPLFVGLALAFWLRGCQEAPRHGASLPVSDVEVAVPNGPRARPLPVIDREQPAAPPKRALRTAVPAAVPEPPGTPTYDPYVEYQLPPKCDGVYFACSLGEYIGRGDFRSAFSDPYLRKLLNPAGIELSDTRIDEIYEAHRVALDQLVSMGREVRGDRRTAMNELARQGVYHEFEGTDLPHIPKGSTGGVVELDSGKRVFVTLGWGQVGWYDDKRRILMDALQSTVTSIRRMVVDGRRGEDEASLMSN